MTKQPEILSRLPELPAEMFERSAKLDYAEYAPIITNLPEPLVMAPPVGPPPAEPRESITIRYYFAWIVYPKVICHPFVDEVAVAALRLNDDDRPRQSPVQTGMPTKATRNDRSHYRLSRLRGQDLVTPYGCEVRSGPWAAEVERWESCEGFPDRWQLYSPVIGVYIQWSGQWDDIPSYPNLIVVMGSLSYAREETRCCDGFIECGPQRTCVPRSLCKDPWDTTGGPIA